MQMRGNYMHNAKNFDYKFKVLLICIFTFAWTGVPLKIDNKILKMHLFSKKYYLASI